MSTSHASTFSINLFPKCVRGLCYLYIVSQRISKLKLSIHLFPKYRQKDISAYLPLLKILAKHHLDNLTAPKFREAIVLLNADNDLTKSKNQLGLFSWAKGESEKLAGCGSTLCAVYQA